MATRGVVVRALADVGGQESLGESAAALAGAGIPVFPCAVGGKPPLIARGFHSATSDGRQVARWWATIPSANIGVPTGAASGVVVVDVDVHGATNGYQALNRALRARLLDGWEATIRTPSGGLHVYFPAAAGVEQRSWQATRAGIDFRGDGGYIIVPPSQLIIDGRVSLYEILATNTEVGRSLNSQALRDFLDPRPSVVPGGVSPPSAGAIDVERLASWVARRQEGERNHGLFWAACKMAEHRVPAAEALRALTVAGEQAGLSPREVTTTVRSAYRAVQTGPPLVSVRHTVNSELDDQPPGRSVRTLS